MGEVYQAAQKGNKHAMFAVVMYFKDFNGVVPLDSFKRYQRVLIEDGSHEVISQASSDEFNEKIAAIDKNNHSIVCRYLF